MMNQGHKTSCVITDFVVSFIHHQPWLCVVNVSVTRQKINYFSVSGDASKPVRWAGLTNIRSVKSSSAGKGMSQSVSQSLHFWLLSNKMIFSSPAKTTDLILENEKP